MEIFQSKRNFQIKFYLSCSCERFLRLLFFSRKENVDTEGYSLVDERKRGEREREREKERLLPRVL